ncbi:hypothetical protein INR49_000641 [Caranx melampygus]|nr:hypothetical protein INR49_000641 [Caranx melampygus]
MEQSGDDRQSGSAAAEGQLKEERRYATIWDNELARTAEAWAATCMWAHGPPYLLQFYGQNLSVRTGGYQSILQLVKPWYDEVNDYVFPYPRLCNPSCPLLCYGPMCTHYTQMVWASTNRVGCAVQTCYNMFVWGALWTEATFLVCNYSPKGNWIGEAPYRVGVPCSACPSSYGGACSNNMCFPTVQSNYMYWFKFIGHDPSIFHTVTGDLAQQSLFLNQELEHKSKESRSVQTEPFGGR